MKVEEPPSFDTIEYDPDSMFSQYQLSANATGMFRRYPFQRASTGTCATQDDFHIFTVLIVGVLLPRHYAHK
jgi:hypothetical protein